MRALTPLARPPPRRNERAWGSVDYVLRLRGALDAAGLGETRIVVPDGGDCAGVTGAAATNASFAAAVYALGEHYPCKRSCPATAEVGLKFWASEDYSTVADWAGAGCWGRSLSQNWVLLNATSTIAWSTIWSVYASDIYFGNGLMYVHTLILIHARRAHCPATITSTRSLRATLTAPAGTQWSPGRAATR